MIDVTRLESIAQQLVARVRDTGPEHNRIWLDHMTTAEERHALLYILAAAVPDTESWRDLTAWCGDPRVEERRRQWRDSVRRKRATGGGHRAA